MVEGPAYDETRRGERWTEEEDEKLTRLYPTMGAAAVCKATGRSMSSVSSRAKKLGVRARTGRGRSCTWTEREDRVAVAHLAEVCRSTGRSPVAVCHHLEWLLRKSRSLGDRSSGAEG